MRITSKILFASGIIFSLLSAIRYYVLFPDLDKVIAYVIIGILLSSLGWIHYRLDFLRGENETLWRYFDEVVKNKIMEKKE